MVAELLGGVVCPAGRELPLSPSVAGGGSRAHPAQVSQEGAFVSSPADRSALAQHTLHQRLCLVIVQGERNWESLCLSLQELDQMILLYHPQHCGTA